MSKFEIRWGNPALDIVMAILLVSYFSWFLGVVYFIIYCVVYELVMQIRFKSHEKEYKNEKRPQNPPGNPGRSQQARKPMYRM